MRTFLLTLAFLAVGACGGKDDETTDDSAAGDDDDVGDDDDDVGDDDDAGDDDDDTDVTELPETPVDDTTLAGRTYAVDLAGGNFVEPAGVGPLLSQFLTQDILIGVVAADTAAVTLRGAISDDSGAQDVCAPSIEFPAADFSQNPFFQVGPQSLTLTIEGVSITIDELVLNGAFANGGSEIVGATLAGAIDTRPLAPLLGATGDDEAVCALVQGFGVSCVACADGSGDYCLEVYVNKLSADEQAGVTLDEITQADVDGNAACNPS